MLKTTNKWNLAILSVIFVRCGKKKKNKNKPQKTPTKQKPQKKKKQTNKKPKPNQKKKQKTYLKRQVEWKLSSVH
ncbi:hypothetical protein llap_21668 [Limosa lapponica baueri]|uniref:Uncharacterized protein n=1 Tax=Limosa lapponica baueri TaxID=1758121 RepID=A0A2I0T2K4_LIMLA|nr:hypothetical protein llap_21668 [Limosa lapponica baueri]